MSQENQTEGNKTSKEANSLVLNGHEKTEINEQLYMKKITTQLETKGLLC